MIEELLERVEDAADLKWLRKSRREGVSYRPFSDYLSAKRPSETAARRAAATSKLPISPEKIL
jgi:hypothetical protein